MTSQERGVRGKGVPPSFEESFPYAFSVFYGGLQNVKKRLEQLSRKLTVELDYQESFFKQIAKMPVSIMTTEGQDVCGTRGPISSDPYNFSALNHASLNIKKRLARLSFELCQGDKGLTYLLNELNWPHYKYTRSEERRALILGGNQREKEKLLEALALLVNCEEEALEGNPYWLEKFRDDYYPRLDFCFYKKMFKPLVIGQMLDNALNRGELVTQLAVLAEEGLVATSKYLIWLNEHSSHSTSASEDEEAENEMKESTPPRPTVTFQEDIATAFASDTI